jgi:hypothetical protein
MQKKAFDSVSHHYIRAALTEYGIGNFNPIFDLLYNEQKVDIAINNDLIKGYNIKNGVKQGDSLSCILFILCIDPLIRNIESNMNIERIELGDHVLPKVVAYADDITCLVDSKRSLRHAFKEYECLSKASGLVLNADKTEIRDKTSALYKFKYMDETYRVKGLEEAKINGIIFNRDDMTMKEKNYEMLMNKINNSLSAWRTRSLSLLGKILIYKTFGLSQITYVLTAIELDEAHHKSITNIYFNYLWGRDLGSQTVSNRISKHKLCLPISSGGFGMIEPGKVIEGIRCKQLGKLFGSEYNHPLRNIVLNDNTSYIQEQCLTEYADPVAKEAIKVLRKNFFDNIKKMSNEQIASDLILLQQLGTVETVHMVKENWLGSREHATLIFNYNCANLRDTAIACTQQRRLLTVCKRLLKSVYYRILQVIYQRNIVVPEGILNKIKLVNGTYRNIELITSKEFRHVLQMTVQNVSSRFKHNLDNSTLKEYFKQIKRLSNTRHKNTLLRVWNGDCLSYSRLHHFGVVDMNACPHCGEYDTPEHMLFECGNVKRMWEMLMEKIPKPGNRTLMHYAIGINDTRTELMIKAELLKYAMHFREMEPEVKLRKTFAYLKAVNKNNTFLTNLY